MMSFLFHACFVVAVVSPSMKLDTRSLIEQALDEPTQITFENSSLADAIDLISQKTGVPLVMEPEVMRLAPRGGDTKLQHVDIAGISLREGLTRLFKPLGMRFVVRNDHVAILATNAIRCLTRPPTWEELDTLHELAALQPGVDTQALEAWKTRIQFQVPVQDAWMVLAPAMRNVGSGSGDEALTIACRNLEWSWCLSGPRVVVRSAQQQIQRQLAQPISLRLHSRPFLDALRAVGRAARVSVRAEPGALASLPMAMRQSFSLQVEQQPAGEVLESVAAYTGLGYWIDPQGVMFFRPGTDAGPRDDSTPPSGGDGPAQPTSTFDPYVGKISVPLEDGTSMEWLIRRSELPPDLRQQRKEDIQKAFETLRRKPPPLRGDR